MNTTIKYLSIAFIAFAGLVSAGHAQTNESHAQASDKEKEQNLSAESIDTSTNAPSQPVPYAQPAARFEQPPQSSGHSYHQQQGRFVQPDRNAPGSFNPRDPNRGYHPPSGSGSKK